ncbi:hypothetical protein Mapa_012182 [Marchantia paleacea]|nr:hypothetical protein Mapa_012182 [Marchantia paleacea]
MAEFNESGTVKNAWPEYFNSPSRLAFEGLNVDTTVPNVYFQDPSLPGESPPLNPGNPEDVWVYGDGNDNVLGIPKRGLWHFNRLNPGWPELLGKGYKEAIDTIVSEEYGIQVVYGPEGFPRIQDFNLRRVFVDVDKAGNVAVIPKLG